MEECAAPHNSRFVAFTFILPDIFIRIAAINSTTFLHRFAGDPAEIL